MHEGNGKIVHNCTSAPVALTICNWTNKS